MIALLVDDASIIIADGRVPLTGARHW